MRYSKICEDVGLADLAPCPPFKFTYFACKEGQVQEFETEQEARKYSALVDKQVVNRSEIEAWNAKYTELSNAAFDIWYAHLVEMYPQLTEQQFILCYDFAYNDCNNGDDLDEVANTLSDVVVFAEKLLSTVSVDK